MVVAPLCLHGKSVLHMSETADLPDHVPSTGTSNNRAAQYLENTAGGVGLPIWAFPRKF